MFPFFCVADVFPKITATVSPGHTLFYDVALSPSHALEWGLVSASGHGDGRWAWSVRLLVR